MRLSEALGRAPSRYFKDRALLYFAGAEQAPAAEQGGAEAPIPQVLSLAPVLTTLPMAHDGGDCAITRTATVIQCEEYCCVSSTCGSHHWNASTCTCYCGGDLI